MIKLRYQGRIKPQPGWSLPVHFHTDFHELIVVLAGRLETTIGGQVLVGRPSDVLIYPQMQPHAERSVGPRPLEHLYFAWHGDAKLVSQLPLLSRDATGRTTTAVRWMESIRLRGGDPALLDGLAAVVVDELLAIHTATDDDAIARVQRHVREHFADAMTLDDLAGVAKLSRFHFARRFKQKTGVAPATFLRQVRVDAARQLLQTTPLPLREIAPRVGLADEYHLSRVFRQTTGMAPSSLRG